jgi:hypothetical protein
MSGKSHKIAHPKTGVEINGWILPDGSEYDTTDVYDGMDGWRYCPMPGKVPFAQDMIYVRPVKAEPTTAAEAS